MPSRTPRKRALRSLVALDARSDAQLLAQIIAVVTADPDPLSRAHKVLSGVQDLACFAGATPHDLFERCDADRALSEVLAAGLELGIRCCEREVIPPARIQCSADVARALGPRLRLLDHEQLWILALDASSRPVGMRRLAEGGRHGCAVLARDVLRSALSLGACSFVLAHNHPGGDPAPSRHDLQLTHAVARAAACIGLPLVDHVIVTRSAHASLLDLGLLAASEGLERAPLPAAGD